MSKKFINKDKVVKIGQDYYEEVSDAQTLTYPFHIANFIRGNQLDQQFGEYIRVAAVQTPKDGEDYH